MKRRRLIGFAATAGLGTMAGCLDSFGDSSATLQRFTLVNDRDEPVTAELRIELDDTDEVVHEDTYEMDSGVDDTLVDCVWPDEPLRILVRNADDEDWNEFSTADKDGCVLLLAEIHDRGASFFRSIEECPARSPDCHTDVEE